MNINIVGVNADNKTQLIDKYGKYDNFIFIPDIFIKSINQRKNYKIWRGSRYSAKSWTKALELLINCGGDSYFRAIYARVTQKAARDSQFQLFQDLLSRYKILRNEFIIEKTSMKIIHKKTGNYLQGGSFENPEGLLSVPDLTDFWCEEPISRDGSIDRRKFEDIYGTARNPYGITTQAHLTFNPISKNNFVYEDFYSDNKVYDSNSFEDIVANYYDNPFCPQDRIDYLDSMKKRDYARWLVDGAGEWGIAEVKSPAFPTFDVKKHVGKTEMVSGIPLLFWIDFNNDPLACTVWQIYRDSEGHKIRGLKEIKITPKEGIHNTQLLIDFIKANYPNHLHSLCMTTDATGSQRTAAGLSNILQLNKAFNLGRRLQTPTVNPKVKDSVELVNYVLYHHPNILIDPSMETLIFELQNTERDADGGLVKDKRDDATQRADFVDTFRYGINWHFFLNDNIYKYPAKFGIKV